MGENFLVRLLMGLLLCVFTISYSVETCAGTNIENVPFGYIIYVDRTNRFIIFNMGRNDGIKENCSLDVYRKDVKIAKVRAVKIRTKFTAGEIECSYEKVAVADMVKPSSTTLRLIREEKKKIMQEELYALLLEAEQALQEKKYEQAQKYLTTALKLEPQNNRAWQLLDAVKGFSYNEKLNGFLIEAQKYIQEEEYELGKTELEFALEIDPQNKQAWKMLKELFPKITYLKSRTLTVNIDAPKHLIHSACLEALRVNGYILRSSDLMTYNIEASKYIDMDLPLPQNPILQDQSLTITNKVYSSFEIKGLIESTDKITNRLVMRLRAVHDTEGHLYNYEIEEDSPIYNEAQKIVSTIRNSAEKLFRKEQPL